MAEIEVMGCIEQFAATRAEFVQAGLDYLHRFQETAGSAKEGLQDLMQHSDEEWKVAETRQIVALIEEWTRDSREVCIETFSQLLAKDWDERHDDEAA